MAWPLGVAGRARALLGRIAAARRARIAFVLALVLTPLLAGGWLWLRNSSFVAVRQVRVSGVHGPEAGRIAAVLQTSARSISTLHVDLGALQAAVAPFAIVREVRARAEFPHGLRIEVIEQPPVAALTVAGSRTAVAADGVVLGPALLTGSLPALTAAYVPGVGQRVGNASLLASLSVLGAAPAPLARLVKNVFTGPKGLTVAMRNGLLAYFGDATRPHAKWFSLARVLADSSSAGASYVDVRLPARPAAGFPAGVAPPAAASAGSATSEVPSPGESTVTALAASLTAGQPGASKKSEEPATPSATPSTGASSSSSGSESTPSSSGESEAEAAPGASPPATGEASETTSTPGG